MPGSKGEAIVIQGRDRHLLEELAAMRVVDREQVKIVGRFGSTTRVNTRLLALTRAGFLRRFFLGTTAGGTKALYTLSAKGAKLVGVPLRGPQRLKDELRAVDFFVTHQLIVNEVYCALKYGTLPDYVAFRGWRPFFGPIVPEIRLIPDGYVELSTPAGILGAFIEIDRGGERGPVWGKKIAHYLQFAVRGVPERDGFKRPFRVLVIAPTERRAISIRATSAHMTDKIFWFASLDAIRRDGVFAPIWLRPTGDTRLPLIKELP